MRYKFDLSPSIKATVEWQLQYYREDCRQLEQLKLEMIPSTTQAYSKTAGVDGGEAGRTTENVALRMISSPYIRRLEITCEAITRALSTIDETDHRLIELIYWRREYTVEGAGLKCNLSKSAAYKRINKILGLVAYELGYISVI